MLSFVQLNRTISLWNPRLTGMTAQAVRFNAVCCVASGSVSASAPGTVLAPAALGARQRWRRLGFRWREFGRAIDIPSNDPQDRQQHKCRRQRPRLTHRRRREGPPYRAEVEYERRADGQCL